MNFIKALAVFAGTIIGVGIFGLPYVALKAGFPVVLFYFFLLACIAAAIHLMYAEVSLGTTGLKRLPGFAQEYLGRRWKTFTFLAIGSGLLGALLAYLVVGGNFLNSFLSPYFGGSAVLYTLFFWALGSFFIFRGIKSICTIEFFLLVVFFAILGIFFFKSYSFIELGHLKGMNSAFLALPYGVILFSLWGSNIVPEIREFLGNNPRAVKKVIILGILLSALTYLFFIYTVLGTSGSGTSKEAISGLARTLGNRVIRLAFVFGIITCFTSFLTLGLTLKKVLWYDFNLHPVLAWAVVSFLPLFMFLAGMREFIEIISLTGALSIGCMGIVMVFLYRQFLKKRFNRRMSPLIYILPAFFVLGIIFEIISFFSR